MPLLTSQGISGWYVRKNISPSPLERNIGSSTQRQVLRKFGTSQRKTFKKLYEQKDLVRNTKDQYAHACNNVWKNSEQRLLGDWSGDRNENTFDFFDINSGKVLSAFNGRYNSETVIDLTQSPIASRLLSVPGYEAANVELRITRKNAVKITNMSRFGNDDNRSVVNVASDKFYQQTKMKKLSETFGSER